MKKTFFFFFVFISAILSLPLAAENLIEWSNGTINLDELKLDDDLKDDLIKLINDHKNEIINALNANDVSQDDADSAINEAVNAYNDKIGDFAKFAPYTTTIKGLNCFTDSLVDAIPNSQIQQNVWANSWIGSILPKPNFGFGINTGVSKLDVSPLVDVIKTFDENNEDSGLPETLVWPTITADFRVGGFMFPFDLGFTVMSFDSDTIGSIGNAIDPAYFDFFMIGGDVRYALLQGGLMRPKVSVGLGLYHTSGDFGVEDDGSSAELDFSSTSLVLSAQASIKLLFFVPFAGTKVMFTKSNVDWKVKANWSSILNTNDSKIQEAVEYGFLPSTFTGGSDSGFFNHIRPVIFGGFAFDLFVLDITFSGSYDFISDIPSGAVSIRLALN